MVRKGTPVDIKIPHIGHLTIKNNVAGVVFEKNLLEETRGSTAKSF
mgnify:CR=1 FL=1